MSYRNSKAFKAAMNTAEIAYKGVLNCKPAGSDPSLYITQDVFWNRLAIDTWIEMCDVALEAWLRTGKASQI